MQPLSVSRAARLVGQPRAVLQRMMAQGELASFDGLIDPADLLRAFPQAQLDDAGALERVARIREESFGRRVAERALPPREILAQRLFGLGQELADTRRHLSAYHTLLVGLLGELAARAPHDAQAQAWHRMLEDGLARILGAEPDTGLQAMKEILAVVSANVTVRPSGREFLVEGHDSLLQAGLKAGLGFAYGCGTGNCGLCKARVVSGEVQRIQHSDYRMSAAEQAQGHILLCTHTALGDLVIESLEAASPADIPEQQIVARVKSVSTLGEDTRLLHLQTPRSTRLRFLAGQAVTLGIAMGGGMAADEASAAYPVASCPCDERNLLFHIARDPADPFAAVVFADTLAPGYEVGVRGPTGQFVLDAGSGRPLVFVCCDTGFAPVRALIEHAISVDDAQPIALHWLATRPDGHYLANACKAWAAALDDFAFHPVSGSDPATDGAAMAAIAGRAHGDAADVYVAGPPAFVDAAVAALGAQGAPAGRIFSLVL
jgi:CDP-4-dehydro-6-deoxyglucose reductase